MLLSFYLVVLVILYGADAEVYSNVSPVKTIPLLLRMPRLLQIAREVQGCQPSHTVLYLCNRSNSDDINGVSICEAQPVIRVYHRYFDHAELHHPYSANPTAGLIRLAICPCPWFYLKFHLSGTVALWIDTVYGAFQQHSTLSDPFPPVPTHYNPMKKKVWFFCKNGKHTGPRYVGSSRCLQRGAEFPGLFRSVCSLR